MEASSTGRAVAMRGGGWAERGFSLQSHKQLETPACVAFCAGPHVFLMNASGNCSREGGIASAGDARRRRLHDKLKSYTKMVAEERKSANNLRSKFQKWQKSEEKVLKMS